MDCGKRTVLFQLPPRKKKPTPQRPCFSSHHGEIPRGPSPPRFISRLTLSRPPCQHWHHSPPAPHQPYGEQQPPGHTWEVRTRILEYGMKIVGLSAKRIPVRRMGENRCRCSTGRSGRTERTTNRGDGSCRRARNSNGFLQKGPSVQVLFAGGGHYEIRPPKPAEENFTRTEIIVRIKILLKNPTWPFPRASLFPQRPSLDTDPSCVGSLIILTPGISVTVSMQSGGRSEDHERKASSPVDKPPGIC